MLAYLGRSLASFCSNQWREDASAAHLDQMVRAGGSAALPLQRHKGPNLSVCNPQTWYEVGERWHESDSTIEP